MTPPKNKSHQTLNTTNSISGIHERPLLCIWASKDLWSCLLVSFVLSHNTLILCGYSPNSSDTAISPSYTCLALPGLSILFDLRRIFIIRRMTFKGWHHALLDSGITLLIFLLWIFLLPDHVFWNGVFFFIWSVLSTCENGWDFSRYYRALINEKSLLKQPSKLLACQSEDKTCAILVIPALMMNVKEIRERDMVQQARR